MSVTTVSNEMATRRQLVAMSRDDKSHLRTAGMNGDADVADALSQVKNSWTWVLPNRDSKHTRGSGRKVHLLRSSPLSIASMMLIAAAMLCIGCQKKINEPAANGPTVSEAAKSGEQGPVLTQQPPTRPTTKPVDANVKTEDVKPSPADVPLIEIDFELNGQSFTMMAPEGASVEYVLDSPFISVGKQFDLGVTRATQLAFDNEPMAKRKAHYKEVNGDDFLGFHREEDELLVYETKGLYESFHFHLWQEIGDELYRIEPGKPLKGVWYSKHDCELMLQCARTLARKID